MTTETRDVRIIAARRWIRNDTDMCAELGELEEFLEINGVYYPLKILESVIPIAKERLFCFC